MEDNLQWFFLAFKKGREDMIKIQISLFKFFKNGYSKSGLFPKGFPVFLNDYLTKIIPSKSIKVH